MAEARRRSGTDNDAGDDNGTNQGGRAKTARNGSNDCNDCIEDQIRRWQSFLDELRRDANAKATTDLQVTIPRLIDQLELLAMQGKGLEGQMWVLVDEIAAVMEAMIVCTKDLTLRIALALPPMAMACNGSLQIQQKALATLADIERHCLKSLATIPDYHQARDVIVQLVRKQPEAEDFREALESYDEANARDWRRNADDLLGGCERLVSFIYNHRQLLEDAEPEVNDALNMYR